jgi:hypothetical protein
VLKMFEDGDNVFQISKFLFSAGRPDVLAGSVRLIRRRFCLEAGMLSATTVPCSHR